MAIIHQVLCQVSKKTNDQNQRRILMIIRLRNASHPSLLCCTEINTKISQECYEARSRDSIIPIL